MCGVPLVFGQSMSRHETWATNQLTNTIIMTWIILIQLLVLVFLSFNHKKLESTSNLRPAWGWFSCVFVSQAAMTFFRARYHDDVEELMLVEILANGFVWFFIGMSILFLPSLFLGKPTRSEFFDDNDVKIASYNEEKPKE
jgi:uncharacterized membrane protein